MFVRATTQTSKRKLLGKKKHLVIQTEDGRIIDHSKDVEKGIKKATFVDHLSFTRKRVMIDGKVHHLKQKSMIKYFIRNGTRLTFDRYGSKIYRAALKGFNVAIQFLPRDGKNKSEMRGRMIIKCIEHYAHHSIDSVHFPYDKDPSQFQKNYQDPYKWEKFFISLWKGH